MLFHPPYAILVLDAGAATCSPAAMLPQVSSAHLTLLSSHPTLTPADCAHVPVSQQVENHSATSGAHVEQPLTAQHRQGRRVPATCP